MKLVWNMTFCDWLRWARTEPKDFYPDYWWNVEGERR